MHNITSYIRGKREEKRTDILLIITAWFFCSPKRWLFPGRFVFSFPRFSSVSKSFEWRKLFHSIHSFMASRFNSTWSFCCVYALCVSLSRWWNWRGGGNVSGERDVLLFRATIFMANKNKKWTNDSMRMTVRACVLFSYI